jgi:hypothetical protein
MTNLQIKTIHKLLFILSLICGGIWITGGFIWVPGIIYGFNPETKWPNCPGEDIFLLFILLPIIAGILLMSSYHPSDITEYKIDKTILTRSEILDL